MTTPTTVELTKHITMESMRRYSGEGNIHSDEKAGREQGLGGALAQGGQLAGFLSEMMVRTLGIGFLTAGQMSVSFVQPVRPGDILKTRGTLTSESEGLDGRRLEYDVWLENERGEKVTVGKASGRA